MRRREFIGGGAAYLSGPIVGYAQQRKDLPTIGFLGAGTKAGWQRWLDAFVLRLSQLGWIDGRTISIEVRWMEGRSERFADVAEFVGRNVDVIVTGGDAVLAAKRATSVIPIVFPLSADPIGAGFVQSLSRPGGNVTGLSIQSADLAGKRLEILREVIPGLRQVTVMAGVASRSSVVEINEVRTAARSLGLEFATAMLRSAEDIVPAFNALRNSAEALYVCPEPLANTHRIRINELALLERLPTIYAFREYVEAGGLISFGPNVTELFRRTAEHVDKILRGTKPSEIPIEQPTKFELVINLKTAKALGLTVPPTLLARADEVIE